MLVACVELEALGPVVCSDVPVTAEELLELGKVCDDDVMLDDESDAETIKLLVVGGDVVAGGVAVTEAEDDSTWLASPSRSCNAFDAIAAAELSGFSDVVVVRMLGVTEVESGHEASCTLSRLFWHGPGTGTADMLCRIIAKDACQPQNVEVRGRLDISAGGRRRHLGPCAAPI